jgi:hypothetical protein
LHPGFGELLQGGQFCAENARALSSNAIGPAAFLGWERLNPTLLFQASNRPIQRPRSQTGPAYARDIFNHGMAVLRSTGQARKDKQWRVRIVPESRVIFDRCYFGRYFASRTTHHVVIARMDFLLQGNSMSYS